jgi:hypothetical protein
MKFRNELKYRLNHQDYQILKSRLDALLHKDRNITPAGFYTVRSLYFDDYMNSAYHEKMMGIMNRHKFRIRIYNASDQNIHLERKIKSNRYIYKQTSKLTRDEVNRILQNRFGFLLYSKDNLQKLFYHECVSNLLRPRVVVDYEREPYVLDVGQLRITFDKNVRAGELGFDIFDPEMPMVEALYPGIVIMEVKYSEFLPKMIRKILPIKSSEYSANSKYILCCDLTMHKRTYHTD